MKSIFILFVCSLLVFTTDAQTKEKKVHFEAQINMGIVSNSTVKGKFAYGGTFETLIRMGSVNNVPPIVGATTVDASKKRNYLTFALKGISNPFKGSPFLVTGQLFNKDGNDALNYAMLLAGYRADLGVSDEPENYLYVEPRIGLAFSGGFNWTGFAASPVFGYQLRRVDFQLVLDCGFGVKTLNIHKKSIITPGIGFGYSL